MEVGKVKFKFNNMYILPFIMQGVAMYAIVWMWLMHLCIE